MALSDRIVVFNKGARAAGRHAARRLRASGQSVRRRFHGAGEQAARHLIERQDGEGARADRRSRSIDARLSDGLERRPGRRDGRDPPGGNSPRTPRSGIGTQRSQRAVVESAFLGNIVDHQVDVGGALVRVQGDRRQSLRARRAGRSHDSRRRVRRHARRHRLRQQTEQDMTMKPRNLLFIMSDEHSKRVLGCHGHPMIRTPNLDRLAARGVRFTDAYCNSPICVPSRASFQTGRYVHDIRFWDNAIAYDGSVPSWAHRLKAAGHRVDFDREAAFPQRRTTTTASPRSICRCTWSRASATRSACCATRRRRARRRCKLAADAGCGDSNYQGYDDRITEAARGVAARARGAARTRNPGCCSCRWSARTSR